MIYLGRSVEKPDDFAAENAENKKDHSHKHSNFQSNYLERKLQELSVIILCNQKSACDRWLDKTIVFYRRIY